LDRSEIVFRKKNKRKKIISRKKKNGTHYPYGNNVKIQYDIKAAIKAPANLEMINNPSETLMFFNRLRSKENISYYRGIRFIEISLKSLTEIDFATISILKSIFEEYNYLGIQIRGTFPEDVKCRDTLVEFGYFNNMVNVKGNPIIKVKTQGDHHKFEKAQGKIEEKELILFEKISEECYFYLNGHDGYYDEMETILKEIAGNAVEWGDAYNKQWQVGVFKKDKKVIVNVVDLGKGIIDSLVINEKLKFIDFWLLRNKLDILLGAFQRRYGSFTQEINRNRGLPMIKNLFEQGHIKNLIVCSNEGFINFATPSRNKALSSNFEKFNGTFYQWEIVKE